MDVTGYLQTLRHFWWIVAIWLVLGAAAGYARNDTATPTYASSVGFYVSTTGTGGSTMAASARALNYPEVLSSTKLASAIVAADPAIGSNATQVSKAITSEVPLNTGTVSATVSDTSPLKAQRIAAGIAQQFPRLVDQLDNASQQVVRITLINEPSRAVQVAPRLPVNLALGLVVGLVLGAGSALWSGQVAARSRRRRERRVTVAARPNPLPAVDERPQQVTARPVLAGRRAGSETPATQPGR